MNTDSRQNLDAIPALAGGSTAEVTWGGLIDMQVCVPEEWTDAQIKSFAEHANPCGTSCGWQIRREGDLALAGAKERVKCNKRPNHVHVMLDA